jgi:hypothetical protein
MIELRAVDRVVLLQLVRLSGMPEVVSGRYFNARRTEWFEKVGRPVLARELIVGMNEGKDACVS